MRNAPSDEEMCDGKIEDGEEVGEGNRDEEFLGEFEAADDENRARRHEHWLR
jgi:hypothetical protein